MNLKLTSLLMVLGMPPPPRVGGEAQRPVAVEGAGRDPGRDRPGSGRGCECACGRRCVPRVRGEQHARRGCVCQVWVPTAVG